MDRERTPEEYDEVWSKRGVLDAYLSPHREALYEEVVDFARSHDVGVTGQSIADVGCGPGHFTKILAGRFGPDRLVGFDFSKEVLAVARGVCPAAEFRENDIYEPLGEHFDVLFCTEVLEHLAYPRRALSNLLAASTVTVLSVPNGRLDTYPGHINYWSWESWKVFLEEVGGAHQVDVAYACGGKNIMTVLRTPARSPLAGE